MKKDSVDATGETGEGHPGISTANEEASHTAQRTALRVEHVGNDMDERTTTASTNEETGREHSDSTESKREEQTESVIETEHPGKELPAQCTRSNEEAGSTVLHVSSDMNEKEKSDEEAGETAAAKETEEISKEDVEIRRLIEQRRTHTQIIETASERRTDDFKKCIRDKKRKDSKTSEEYLKTSKGVKNIPGIKSAKKKVLNHQDKE